MILFLNKQDMLTEKIKAGRHRLETYFPEFSNYKLPTDISCDPKEDLQVAMAKYFIRGEFLVRIYLLFLSFVSFLWEQEDINSFSSFSGLL